MWWLASKRQKAEAGRPFKCHAWSWHSITYADSIGQSSHRAHPDLKEVRESPSLDGTWQDNTVEEHIDSNVMAIFRKHNLPPPFLNNNGVTFLSTL